PGGQDRGRYGSRAGAGPRRRRKPGGLSARPQPRRSAILERAAPESGPPFSCSKGASDRRTAPLPGGRVPCEVPACHNLFRVTTSAIGDLDAWRSLPALQQPEWDDPDEVRAVTAELAAQPPLVFAGECDQLKDRLADVVRGDAFVLQGGDCAETFDGSNADAVKNKLKTLLQMAVVLTYAASVPVVKIGRMAGQFAKPRSKPVEVRGGVELPAYRGDAVNGFGFDAESRRSDPKR